MIKSFTTTNFTHQITDGLNRLFTINDLGQQLNLMKSPDDLCSTNLRSV